MLVVIVSVLAGESGLAFYRLRLDVFASMPVLHVGDGALQRAGQINVEQRSVQTVDNSNLLALVDLALVDSLLNAVLTAATAVLRWALRP